MNLKVSDAKREEGFTLIELLVVVIIIGILAAIAIPVFLNQRERAWIRTAESDARNAAIAIESYFNDDFEYPGDDTWTEGVNTINNDEIVVSPNVTLDYVNNTDSYTITATHDLIDSGGSTVAIYDSSAGGIQPGYPQ